MNTGVILALLAAFIALGVVLMAASQNKKKEGASAARDNDDAR